MDKKITVRVRSDVDSILTAIAKDLGVPKSTLCSYVLSDQVFKFLETDVGKDFKYLVDK